MLSSVTVSAPVSAIALCQSVISSTKVSAVSVDGGVIYLAACLVV